MPNKLTLQGGVWVSGPASVMDVVNPSVVLASSVGNVARILAYVVLARALLN